MNAIIGFTRLAMRRSRDLLPEGQYKNLEKILISSEHLLSLINNVLDLSKVQAGQMEVHPVDFALEPLVDMCLRTVEPIVKTERLQLEKRVEPDLPKAVYRSREAETDPRKPVEQRRKVYRRREDYGDHPAYRRGASHRR